MNKALIRTIEVPFYIRSVKISESRRIKPFIKGQSKPIPKKYLDRINIDYEWKDVKVGKRTETRLFDIDTGELVPSNPKVAGKPRYYRIKGQELYGQSINPHVRSKLSRAIKDMFIEALKDVEPIQKESFPIIIECELQDMFYDGENRLKNGEIDKNKKWDVGNRIVMYNKYFEDALCGCPDKVDGRIVPTSKQIIPDDERKYVTGTPGALFTPIPEGEAPKLIYRIFSDLRKLKGFD